MDSTKCRIENGILYPCETLDKALQDRNCAKGLNYLEITHLPTGTVTKSMAVVHSGALPKRGVVANYCPFCGEAIAHHVGGPKPCIPTETLESGVVVVPVELAQRLLKRCREQQLEHERLSEQAADTGMILSAEAFATAATEAEADADALEAILSRLQQNGGEAK